MVVPFFSFEKLNNQIEKEINGAFQKVFKSNHYILGEELAAFEKNYAIFNQTDYAIGVGNGLEALQLSLVALGIGKGDEVIVPAHTFIATIMAIVNVGAVPVLVEPDLNTYNIDVKMIADFITSRTKAIIPVHLYGQSCEMDPILQLAQKYKLFILEDNAQAQGSRYKGKLTGSFGVLNATSFYPVKNLGGFGDGGAITTSDLVLRDKCLVMRNYGSLKKYYYDELGFNSRLDEMQAAFLNVKLKFLDSWNAQRRNIAKMYYDNLSDITEICLPKILPEVEPVFHVFPIRTKDRDDLQQHLENHGVQTLIHYPIPIHLQKAYSFLNYKIGSLPNTEEIAQTILSLPLFIGMDESQILRVSDCIRSYYKK